MEAKTKKIILAVSGIAVVGLVFWWWKSRQSSAAAPATAGSSTALAGGTSSTPTDTTSLYHIQAWVGLIPDPYKTTWLTKVLPGLSSQDLDTLSSWVDALHDGSTWTAAQHDLFYALEAKYGKLTPGF